ncbi:hypothetical protein ASF25_21440 [Methylobacterium sp. Leaf100]|nr:hypothetical protein ASF25_21440 [Methylobacterium sp. Leaf100]
MIPMTSIILATVYKFEVVEGSIRLTFLGNWHGLQHLEIPYVSLSRPNGDPAINLIHQLKSESQKFDMPLE